jgi:transcription elongation factor Elf1
MYSDDYRTRYDCAVCNKQFYQVKDRTTEESTKQSNLKNGTPYIICGNCGQEEKLHWSKTVRILLGWEQNGNKYDYVVGWDRPPAIPGTRIIVPAMKPIIKQVRGCTDCYNEQTSQTAKLGKLHYFGTVNTPKVEQKVQTPNTTVYAPKVEVEVVPYTFPTAGRTKVQRWGETRQGEDYSTHVDSNQEKKK